MKLFILIVLFMLSFNAFAGTCSSLSRPAYSTQQILTSADLNADFDQLVTGHNSFDLGCSADESLETDSLNTGSASGFDVMFNSLKEGCELEAGTSTLLINACRIAVDGNLIKTSTALEVTWTDISTGSETASTDYYVYIVSGSTLNAEISTSTPNSLGFNGTSRIIGKFFNNATGLIATYSLNEWHIDSFKNEGQLNIPIVSTSTQMNWSHCPVAVTAAGVLYSNTGVDCVNDVTVVSTGIRTISFKSNTFKNVPICNGSAIGDGITFSITSTSLDYESIGTNTRTSSTGAVVDSEFYMNCFGVGYP